MIIMTIMTVKERRTQERNIPSSTTNLGKSKLDTPDFTLVAETVLANRLQFGVTIEDMLGRDNTT